MGARGRSIEIEWVDRKLGKICSSDSSGQKKFGAQRWKLLRRRLGEILSAPALADLRGVDRFHELSADRSGQYAMALDGPYRLLFEPAEELEITDGHVDESSVQRVRILEVVDYHG